MHWIDWCITLVPVVIILSIALYSRRYVRGVVDYVAAGRVAGRYVMCVGQLESGLGVIALVALVEASYQTGYAISFWGMMVVPVWTVLSLTGFCVYRFRETKSLSIGQFLEMRYNRPFRIFAATLRTISEMLCNAIGPAVAANFFIYFLGLPHKVSIMGISVPCFAILVGLVLCMAIVVMWPGGRISLLITDSIQGLLSYPIFVVLTGYVLCCFSWGGEIAPVMMDRVKGESFLNPFDVAQLRDFNIFALVVGVVGGVLNRASWIGNDASNAGRTPHEQKMAGILGAWRNGFSSLMCILITIVVLTVMCHEHFAAKAKDIRINLSTKIAEELVPDPKVRATLETKIAAIPEQHHKIGVDKPLSNTNNLDTPYLNAVADTLGHDSDGNYLFQKFRTLYHQMMMSVTLRHMLPVGMAGIFCLLMVMIMLATDDSRIFNSSSTIIQDVVVPLCKNPLTPQQHLRCLRLGAVGVAIFFFICSLFFVQLDYLNMFMTIMTAIWLGGAGPVMLFGLYSRFGNTTGAFSALFVGSGFSVGGIFLQRNWAQNVYPFLEKMGWTSGVGHFLQAVSAPFNPYIVWQMDPVKFPINSYELYFISMMAGVAAYIIGSLVTYRHPYNLERMLHRGKYSIDGERPIEPFTWRKIWSQLISITPEYTTGDKIITWSVFIFSFVYQIGICFVAVLLWNMLSPWPTEWWSHYFFITTIVVGGIIGVVSTVWFLWGGIVDTRRLFHDLAARSDNPLDDGRVIGQVSAMDRVVLGKDADDDNEAK